MIPCKTECWKNSLLLLVDDTPENLQVLGTLLEGRCRTAVATNGMDALNFISKKQPDLILLDIMMPDMNGFEVCKKLKQDPGTQDIPIIFLSARTETDDIVKGLRLGAVDYITKPFSKEELIVRINNHLQLKTYRCSLEELVKEQTIEIMRTRDVTIRSMALLAETRDNETGGHIRRTQSYVGILAEYLEDKSMFPGILDKDSVELIYKSAPLHDIGKVGVPDNILLKPGRLTDEEFDQMKKHTIYGKNALLAAEKDLGSNSFLRFAREIAWTHHEKWDGTGYPENLKGSEIPLCGRIMCLADVYDALISKRVYKPPFSHEKAVSIIIENRGTQFDPDIVDAFLKLEDKFMKIGLEQADTDQESDALTK